MWSLSIDKITMSTLLLLAAIPFAQIFSLNLGFIVLNTQDLIILFLIPLLVLNLIKRRVKKKLMIFSLVSIFIFILYALFSFVISGNPTAAIIQQIRLFFPFFIALIILPGKFIINEDLFLNRLQVAVGISAISALTIHFFFPALISTLFSSNEDTVFIALEGGRLIWSSAVLSFFIIATVVLYKSKTVIDITLLVIIGTAVIFTQNRTLIIFVFLTYLLSYYYVTGKFFKSTFNLISFLGLSLVGFFIFSTDNMRALLERRFFLGNAKTEEFEHAFLIGRVSNYEQYWASFADNFPWGQGFGLPMSITFFGDRIFSTDISIMSFLLPLGILGLAINLIFLIFIFRSFFNTKKLFFENKKYGVFLIISLMALFTSFNIDLFSRNIFVIYLAFFAAHARTEYSMRMSQLRTIRND